MAEASAGSTAELRLQAVVDLIDRYDESCQDDLCECCGTWRSLMSDVRREANGD